MFSRSVTRPALRVAQNRDKSWNRMLSVARATARHPLRGLGLTKPSDIGVVGRYHSFAAVVLGAAVGVAASF